MHQLRFITIYFILLATYLPAQDGKECSEGEKSKFETSVNYAVPTRFGNQINSISLNCLYLKRRLKKNYILISVGITSLYAWGNSSQFNRVSDTLIIKTVYKNSAFGIGPIIQIDPTFVKIKQFEIKAEATVGAILYNKRFPFGGTIYNFMFRVGPTLTYSASKTYFFKVGYKWMHASNGRGYGNQNPFYESQGINLGMIMVL